MVSSPECLALGKNTVPYPETDRDFEREKERYLDLIARELDTQHALVPLLIQHLGEQGFTEVNVTCNVHGWELKASRGTNQSCPTPEHFKKLIEKLIKELNREINGGQILALVIGDQLAAAFQLRRTI